MMSGGGHWHALVAWTLCALPACVQCAACAGTAIANGVPCGDPSVRSNCSQKYMQISNGGWQCGLWGNECLTTGPACMPAPAGPAYKTLKVGRGNFPGNNGQVYMANNGDFITTVVVVQSRSSNSKRMMGSMAIKFGNGTKSACDGRSIGKGGSFCCGGTESTGSPKVSWGQRLHGYSLAGPASTLTTTTNNPFVEVEVVCGWTDGNKDCAGSMVGGLKFKKKDGTWTPMAGGSDQGLTTGNKHSLGSGLIGIAMECCGGIDAIEFYYKP